MGKERGDDLNVQERSKSKRVIVLKTCVRVVSRRCRPALDTALHGADASGATRFSKTLRRNKVLAFLKEQPTCTVAMEYCGGSHYWARAIQQLGHDVKLLPAAYVKPHVKRRKNDANDASSASKVATMAEIVVAENV